MAINPNQVCFWVPDGLKKFKQVLFDRISSHINSLGGFTIRYDHRKLAELPHEVIPIVGCHPDLRPMIDDWMKVGRKFIYWDRGYARRIFATWLPRGEDGGYYRWVVNGFQMGKIRNEKSDRWEALKTEVRPWQKNGKHILIAAPTFPYSHFHHTERWTDETIDALARVTERPIMVRGKESRRSLEKDLAGAHCIVTHGSNAANEAIILGYPAFVHNSCAAALVGRTNLADIDNPAYPDRQPWLNSLAYSQYNERELVDGTLWRLLQ